MSTLGIDSGAMPEPSAKPLGVSVGGILPIFSAADMIEQQKRDSETVQNTPVILDLAAHIRKCWDIARIAKQQTVEMRMFASVRQRRGEYDPQKLTEIRKSGGAEIYMMLTANKCRGASAWLRDVLQASGADKPWSIDPTAVPTLPPTMAAELRQRAIAEVTMFMQATMRQPEPWEMRDIMTEVRAEYVNSAKELAKFKAKQMEDKMEDQLVEGGFMSALDMFIDDLVTFPSAFLKGPVVRRRPTMSWSASGKSGYQLEIKDELVLEWERVDPFMIYPSPSSEDIDDGYLIERHKLRQEDLEALMGVEGYDDGAIRNVLEDYGNGGLQEWLITDSTKALAEGKSTTAVAQNVEETIDALQFWGTVSGQKLIDWGMTEQEVPDPVKQYHMEGWLIGRHVIKAAINSDPLGRKPYYKASYENVPGSFWGNAPTDLVRDCQDMCNAAARAIANNMGIASGPQVYVNTDRVPAGEDIEQIYPWKIWQVTSDPMATTAKPVEFFQPTSNASELMAIYDRFSILADEYCSIPRYMTGDSPTGGAGRTASGMSMLMTNAGKSMKQVLANIDNNIFAKALDRLFFYNMKYSDDDELKGDIKIVAKGANSVAAKEAAAMRRNEYLTIVAGNPILSQIVGPEGLGALLREGAKGLDMNPDDVVPSPEKMKLMKQAIQAAQANQGQAGSAPAPGGQGGGEKLMDGKPTTDNFSPKPQQG